jgi:hypothetical protein
MDEINHKRTQHEALEALCVAFDFEPIENVYEYIHSIRSNTANHCEYTLPDSEDFDGFD